MVALACALNLQRAGASVELVDDTTDNGRASWGAAGHIAIEQVEPLASLKALASAPRRLFAFGGALDFRLSDVAVWGPWALEFLRACAPATTARGRVALGGLLADAAPAWRRLAQALGRPELVRTEGHMVAWESAASTRAGAQAWADADIGASRHMPLSGEMKARLDARLRKPVAGGLQFEETGQFAEIRDMLATLRSAFVAAGGTLRPQRVARLQVVDGRAGAVLQDGEVLTPDRLIVAAGVGSRPLMASIGVRAPVIAERGYHVEGEDLGWNDLPPTAFEDRSIIVVRLGSRLRVTSFVEFAAKDSAPDPRKWARLEQHVAELGLPMGEPRVRWMGARPTMPDYLPAIGVSRRAENLVYAFGHQHLGLTLAATTGEIVAALVTGARPRLDMTPFDLDRFNSNGARQTADTEQGKRS